MPQVWHRTGCGGGLSECPAASPFAIASQAFIRHTAANAAFGQLEDWTVSLAPYKLEFVSLAGGRRAGGASGRTTRCFSLLVKTSSLCVLLQGSERASEPSDPPPAPALGALRRNMARPAGFAGDDYAYSTVAAFKEAVAGVDVVIDETYFNDVRTSSLSTFFQLFNFSAADVASRRWPFLTNGRIFREDRTINDGTYSMGSTGMDWYESATTQPDVVLQDFVAALFPGAAPQFNATRWLRNLARVRLAGSCC